MPSIRPGDFVTGGIVPVDMNLLWKKARYVNFDYTNKAGVVVASTVAAAITFRRDDGEEVIQNYSLGDPKKWQPNPENDGKTLIAVSGNESEKLSTSSNFYILLNNVVNAGFPENRLPENGDISALEGMYAFHIGLPEPKRLGLVTADREDGRVRTLSVPSKILRLPWENKGKGAAKGAGVAKAKAGDAPSAEVADKLIAFIGEQVGEDGITRQNLAVALFKSKAKDPDKDAMANLLYKPEFFAILAATGYTLDGENIIKNE